jgi:hypothetical protein
MRVGPGFLLVLCGLSISAGCGRGSGEQDDTGASDSGTGGSGNDSGTGGSVSSSGGPSDTGGLSGGGGPSVRSELLPESEVLEGERAA